MTLYRDHRGSLSESMKTIIEVKSIDDIRKHIMKDWPFDTLGEITVKPYAYDHRIEWETYAVCVDGNAFGFTNGPLED